MRLAHRAKLGQVVIDGTKLKANASKHKAMSYARMEKEEKRLGEEIRRYFEEVETTDRSEDLRYLGAHTKWYPVSYTEWLVRRSLMRTLYATLSITPTAFWLQLDIEPS